MKRRKKKIKKNNTYIEDVKKLDIHYNQTNSTEHRKQNEKIPI